MRLSLRHAVILKIKFLLGFSLIPWFSMSTVAHCITLAVTLVVVICLDGEWPMSIVEGPAMTSLTSLHCLLSPSTSGTPPFLRMFSLSGIMSTLVRMHYPDTIWSVRVHGAMGLMGLLGWEGLINQLCCT